MGKTLIILALLFSCSLFGQVANTSSASRILQNVLDSLENKYPKLIENPEKYRFKIIFTEIKRTKEKVNLETVGFRMDEKEYLYPASIVKLPTILIGMEEFNKIHKIRSRVTYETLLKFNKEKGCMPTAFSVMIGKKLEYYSLDLFTKQMLGVSDNDAYNRMFDFVGQQQLNRRLKDLKYQDGKIIRKFVLNCSLDQNRISDSYVFLGKRNEWLYNRRGIANPDTILTDTTYKIGKGYEGLDKKIVPRPFDFSRQNNLELVDLHKTLNGVVFPKSEFSYTFDITEEQRKYVLQNMGKYPAEFTLDFNPKDFPATYKKYLFFGKDSSTNYTNDSLSRFRSFNVVGLSFGCAIDAAYIVDLDTGKEFVLTVGIYANEDEVINDAKYDYETFAYPLMKDIGRLIMNQLPENKDNVTFLREMIEDIGLKR
jgi:hypothetical protein